MWESIVQIEEIGYSDAIDIEVSGNHLFYANDILTHNSSTDIGLEDTSECIYIKELVTLIDGTKKEIQNIVPGDQILSQDDYKTVMFVHHKKPKECVKIKLKSGKSIIVSKDHVFPTKNGRKCINTGLNVGDILNTK